MRYTRTLQMYVTAVGCPRYARHPRFARHLALQALVETDGFEISLFERLHSILANKCSFPPLKLDQLQVTARNRLYADVTACNGL